MSAMIGMLPPYHPPPFLYCPLRKCYCDAYEIDPCTDCPYNAKAVIDDPCYDSSTSSGKKEET